MPVSLSVLLVLLLALPSVSSVTLVSAALRSSLVSSSEWCVQLRFAMTPG